MTERQPRQRRSVAETNRHRDEAREGIRGANGDTYALFRRLKGLGGEVR